MTAAPVYTQPLRYGTDLGRLNPSCTAKRHGTYTAFREGCRCPHAREAWRIYQKRRREGRAERRLYDATGLRRRIQALWALGHNSQTISEASGGAISAEHICLIPRRTTVTAHTRQAILLAYRQLAVKPGTSATTRRRAAAAGWPSPAQWGPEIDDPEATSETDGSDPDLQLIDDVAVNRALQGDKVSLTTPELVVALKKGVGDGEPLSVIADRLGLNYYGARQMLAGEVTPRREQRARVEAAVVEMGATHKDTTIAALLGVHHQTVTRARARLARRQKQLAS